MRAAMYYKNDDVRLVEVPQPEIGKNEILVRVEASGICGSDVMEWYRVKKAPLVLGHEIAGVVAEIGSEVKKFKVGERVTVAHHVPCNTCRYCLNDEHSVCDMLRTTNFSPGGFCEYVRVPAPNVDRGTFILPEELSFELASFSEPLGCVVRGQRKAQFRPGMTTLVIGSGLAGLLHLKLAKAQGATRLIATDINEYRLRAAKEVGGADVVLNASELTPENLRAANGGRLADFVVVCAGAKSAVEQSFKCVERGGTILLFALLAPGETVPFPFWELWRDNIRITTAYASPPLDTQTAIDLLASGRVRVADMITHRLPLARAAEGFRLTAEAKEAIKVILFPQEK